MLFCVFLLEYHWFLANNDLVAYAGIAEKYAQLELRDAINGYWSPLISWLMAPVIWLGFDSLQAFRIVLILSGVAAFYFAQKLARAISLPLLFQVILLSGLFMLFADGAMASTSPDLLHLAALLAYLHVLLKSKASRFKSGVFIGVLAAIGYFAKHYTVVFFAMHFVSLATIRFIRSYRHRTHPDSSESNQPPKAVMKWVLGTLVGFLLPVGLWVLTISLKYDTFTFANAAAYNNHLTHPDDPGHPHMAFKLFEPPNASATSIWEDPSLLPMESWRPMASGEEFAHFKRTLRLNALDVHNILRNYFELYWLPVLLLLLIPLIKPLQFELRLNDIALILALVVFPAGYLLLQVRERFLLLMAVLVLLIGLRTLAFLSSRDFPRPFRVAATLLAIAFAWAFSQHPFREMWYGNTYHIKNHYEHAKKLADENGIRGCFVSNGHWDTDYSVAYIAGLQLYGLVDICASSAFAQTEINSFKPDYFFEWQDLPLCELPTDFQEVEDVEFWNLKVYRINLPAR